MSAPMSVLDKQAEIVAQHWPIRQSAERGGGPKGWGRKFTECLCGMLLYADDYPGARAAWARHVMGEIAHWMRS